MPGTEKICVSFHDINFDVKLNVQLRPLDTNRDDAEYMEPMLLVIRRGETELKDISANI